MDGISLYQVFIYLFAAVICVPIAKKSALGSVLGYLIAGVLIGPFVLGPYLGITSGEDEVHDIMEKAEFGVVMMLFLVGLELDPREFWSTRKKIVGLGGLQMLLTMLIVVPLALRYVLPSLSTALAIGFAVSVSSTAIILQTLSEKGMTKTPVGKNSFAVLLFQDIMVIPILAVLPLLALSPLVESAPANGESTLLAHAPAWMKTLAIVSAIAIVYFVGNYIVNPFFKYIARVQVRELFTSFALMLVIGVSLLMSYVGLSAALGAFMAGLTLANSEFKHQLESDIEPFKALLLGLFFLTVGSTINFNLIRENPFLILGLTFGILGIKAIVLFIIGLIYKLKFNQSFLFALLLSQIGEFAFVILNLSDGLRIIPDTWVELLMATTAITMAVTPLLLIVNEKWIVPIMGLKKTADGGYHHDLDYTIPDTDDKKVLIAGFGDFGLSVGRLLKYNGFQITVLDNNTERVELVRKLGYNVYYGDATNLNTLKAAKADEADILVAAIDPSTVNRVLVNLAKENFPNLKIFVRSRNRYDSFYYLNKGFNFNQIYRENFYTAVQVGVDILRELGVSHKDAVIQGEIFAIADRRSLTTLSKYSDDLERYIEASKKEMEKVELSIYEGMNWEKMEIIDTHAEDAPEPESEDTPEKEKKNE